MSSLEQFAAVNLQDTLEKNLLRELKVTEKLDSVHVLRDGKKLISFASNDYLGLAQHPTVKKAAVMAAEKYGVGAGASRYITGNHSLYPLLERKIADFLGFADACVLGSGYLANVGAIPALVGKGDLIIADKLVHACIIDGAKLSDADFLRFRHNDLKNLREVLKKNRHKYRNILMITEKIFSMEGDRSALAEIAEIGAEYDAWILCDAAHSLYFKEKYPQENFLLMGTFSKALGSYGGYICGTKIVMDFLRNKMRSAIFATALPPPVIAASIAALGVVEKNQSLSLKALAQAELFASLLGLKKPESAIVPFIIGDEKRALLYAKSMKKNGFLVAAIRSPTVPKNTSRLRFSFSAVHPENMVERLAETLKKIIK